MRKYILLLLSVYSFNHGFGQTDSLLLQDPVLKSRSPSRIFIKAYGGYGFFSPGSYRLESVNSYYITRPGNLPYDTMFQTQGEKGIGGGLRFGGGLGYILNDFWSIGVDFEYQKSQKLTNSLNTKGVDYAYDSTSDEMHYEAMTLTPYITFKAVSKPDYFLYNRLGILLTLPFTLHETGKGNSSRPDYWPPGPNDSSMAHLRLERKTHKDSYEVSLGLGFNLAFGINYRLTNQVRVYAELFGNFSALKPERSTVNSVTDETVYYYSGVYDYNVDPPVYIGNELLSRQDKTYLKVKTTYHNGGSTGTKEESYVWGGPGQPLYIVNSARDQRFQINMNSIGINCGIIIRF